MDRISETIGTNLLILLAGIFLFTIVLVIADEIHSYIVYRRFQKELRKNAAKRYYQGEL